MPDGAGVLTAAVLTTTDARAVAALTTAVPGAGVRMYATAIAPAVGADPAVAHQTNTEGEILVHASL